MAGLGLAQELGSGLGLVLELGIGVRVRVSESCWSATITPFYIPAVPKDRSDQRPKCLGTKVTAHHLNLHR